MLLEMLTAETFTEETDRLDHFEYKAETTKLAHITPLPPQQRALFTAETGNLLALL